MALYFIQMPEKFITEKLNERNFNVLFLYFSISLQEGNYVHNKNIGWNDETKRLEKFLKRPNFIQVLGQGKVRDVFLNK